MYHPSTPCGAHVPRTAGFSCTMHLVPNGAMGVRLKSCGPLSMASADMRGFNLDGLSKFSVMFVWSMRRSHSCKGKRGSRPHKIDMKWFFHVRIARSAALALWRWGGTSWKDMSFLFIRWISSLEHSLSKISNLGLRPRMARYLYTRSCALAMAFAVLSLRGSAIMALAS